MDWQTASAYYINFLEKALSVQRHALNLARMPQTGISPVLVDELVRQAAPAQRQLERLKKNEFRIAVVGLEKAGKSTFVNAWLDYDLLPNDSERCTFTTTQVFSVSQTAEQKLIVRVRTPEQLDNLILELQQAVREKTGEEAQRAAADLATINKHRLSLNQTVAEGNQEFQFTRLEEITEKLRKYVANARYAHAVSEAQLYTERLARLDDIVFYDVPGLNSGLAKHIEESRAMLIDCDAVILIQDSTKPNLEASEQKLIEFIRQGDEVIGVAGKLFVFFGKIDRQGSPESLENNITTGFQDWHERGKLPKENFISGSAAAYLLFRNLAGDNLQRDTGGAEIVKNNLIRLTGITSEEGLLRESGIPVIKQRVENYLRFERVGVLKKRCEEPIRIITQTAEEIYSEVSSRYSEDPEEAKRIEERNRKAAFGAWWEKYWVSVLANVNNYLSIQILRRADDNSNESNAENAVETLKQRYSELIEHHLGALPSRQSAARQEIFEAYSNFLPDPTKVNIEWRERLYNEVAGVIEIIARELALELQREAFALVDYITSLLWNGLGIRERLIDSERNLQKRLKGNLETLFLRFARPVSMAIIRTPVDTISRREQITHLKRDIELLDSFYEGEEIAYRQLRLYALYGRHLLEDAELRKEELGVGSTNLLADWSLFSKPDQQTTSSPRSQIRMAASNEEVVKEVETDLEALKVYLLEAVFAAAGFETFWEQELIRLVERFKELKGTWNGLAFDEYMAGNPLLLQVIPDELKNQPYDLEVSERLRQLKIALHNARQIDDVSGLNTSTGEK
jgi:GTPase Era involved in 16S rRNA processing